MPTTMTKAEIDAQFPDEWILVADPDSGPDHRVRSGVLVAHSKDRDEVDRIALKVPARRFAFWFSGDLIPAGMKVLL